MYGSCSLPQVEGKGNPATLQALSKGGADQDASRSPQACEKKRTCLGAFFDAWGLHFYEV